MDTGAFNHTHALTQTSLYRGIDRTRSARSHITNIVVSFSPRLGMKIQWHRDVGAGCAVLGAVVWRCKTVTDDPAN